MVRRFLSALGLGAALAFGATWFAGIPFVAAGDPCYHSFEMPAATTGTDTEIKVAPCAFVPTVTRVAVGSTVKFVNGPDFVHLVTGANQAWGSRDTTLDPGKSVIVSVRYARRLPVRLRTPPRDVGRDRGRGSDCGRRSPDERRHRTGGDGVHPATEAVPADQPAGNVGIVVASAMLGALVALAAVMLVSRWRRASSSPRPDVADPRTAG